MFLFVFMFLTQVAYAQAPDRRISDTNGVILILNSDGSIDARISDGTTAMSVNADGSLPVKEGSNETPVLHYTEVGVASSDTTVWPLTSSSQIVVTDMLVSASADSRMTLQDGSTDIFSAFILADSPFGHNFKTSIVGTSATSMDMTITAGEATVTLSGYEDV